MHALPLSSSSLFTDIVMSVWWWTLKLLSVVFACISIFCKPVSTFSQPNPSPPSPPPLPLLLPHPLPSFSSPTPSPPSPPAPPPLSSTPYRVQCSDMNPTDTQMFRDVLDKVGEEFSRWDIRTLLPDTHAHTHTHTHTHTRTHTRTHAHNTVLPLTTPQSFPSPLLSHSPRAFRVTEFHSHVEHRMQHLEKLIERESARLVEVEKCRAEVAGLKDFICTHKYATLRQFACSCVYSGKDTTRTQMAHWCVSKSVLIERLHCVHIYLCLCRHVCVSSRVHVYRRYHAHSTCEACHKWSRDPICDPLFVQLHMHGKYRCCVVIKPVHLISLDA